jgi:threonyl-tRNA synthetase
MKEKGIRAEVDLRNEKISYKIREHSVQKVPYIAILGKKEVETKQITLRRFGEEEQRTLPLSEAVALLAKEGAPPL